MREGRDDMGKEISLWFYCLGHLFQKFGWASEIGRVNFF